MTSSYADYFSVCERSGRLGEEYLLAELESRLSGSGLLVKLKSDENKNAPFDLEIFEGDRVLVGIENKDLGPATQGTWIKRTRKKRKLAYARQCGIRLILTTITRRDAGQIGFKEGIVNGSPVVFDYDLGRLVDRILDMRRPRDEL